MPVENPARPLNSLLGILKYPPMVPQGPNIVTGVIPPPRPNDKYNHYCIVDNLLHHFSIEWGSECRTPFGMYHMVANQV